MLKKNRENQDEQTDFDDEPSEIKFPSKFNGNHGIYRAMSTVSANQTLVNNHRNVLAKNFRRISINDEIVTIDHTDGEASFVLPNLSDLSDEIRSRSMKSLVDLPTMNNLEETKRLNWWAKKQFSSAKLYPLVTSGDGNCLLHATSLAMWGFHDHSLSMRKALNETMISSKANNSLYRRWRWAQSVQNKKYGLVFSEEEWAEEWKNLLRLSSTEPRTKQNFSTKNSENDRRKVCETNNAGSSGQSTRRYYESLEEFHVYVLANNIRRAIIVFSDTVLRTNDGEPISPIEFGGIYLPLEIPPEKCHKQPVFLAFDSSHFSALVPMEQNTKSISKGYRIPLIDLTTKDLLPIHFFVDPGPDFRWPIDEELSDEKIHLYTNFSRNRMETIEFYLNLCSEKVPIEEFEENFDEEQIPTIEISRSNVTEIENSSSTNETNSSSNLNGPKKTPRTSLNSFSKIFRRTFFELLPSSKRSSFRQQKTNQSFDLVSNSMSDENERKIRLSSPFLDPKRKVLTIILTNFQPKRPKTSDNMIKNYIDTLINESRQEKNFGRSMNFSEEFHFPKKKIEQKQNQISNFRFDENDDFFSTENGEFSSNINYLQRKPINVKQSQSFDSNPSRSTSTENSSKFRRKVIETMSSSMSNSNSENLTGRFSMKTETR